MADPTSRTQRVKLARSIFDDLVDRDASTRERLLRERCGNDVALRCLVEGLFEEQDRGVLTSRECRSVAITKIFSSEDGATRISGDARSAADVELVGKIISHYRIQERLGAGGMGEVHLAHDLALGRTVALKLLPAGFHPSIRERLLREAWASAKVQHPAIATFFEAGRADDVDFIAMEFVPGRTLREHLRDGPLPVQKATGIAESLLEALVHAHFSGILHRDIKPENVMLAERGTVKLLDFGLARGVLMEGTATSAPETWRDPESLDTQFGESATAACDQGDACPSSEDTPDAVIGLPGVANLTRAGAVMGTPGYMAPEQLRGEPADERADVFAVGAVLYEMLSGERAFPGSSARERFRAILERTPAPLARAGVSRELSGIVARALEKSPVDRFPSAAEFLKELRRASDVRASPVAMSVAALDFENRSADESRAWLESELPDTLASGLSGIPGVRVVSREKVAKLIDPDHGLSDVELGLRLGCSSVLTGCFDIETADILARFRLTDVATGEVIEDTLTAPLEEIFSLRDQFARLVAAHLNLESPRLSGAAPKLEAYECYGRARRIGMSAQRADLQQAVELLERAIELEPGYARALAMLANTYAMRYHFTSDPRTIETAIDHGRRAVAADPALADARLWLGYALYHAGESRESFRELREARRLDPEAFLPHYFSGSAFLWSDPAAIRGLVEEVGGQTPEDIHVWRREQALQLYQTTIRLNPAFAWGWSGLGQIHCDLGNFDEAVTCLERAVRLTPGSVPPIAGVEGYLAECLRRRGDHDAAHEQFPVALAKLEETDHIYRDTWRGLFLTGLGRNYLALGDADGARAAFKQAILHLRGRPARCGGHVLVQALAGTARAGASPAQFEEAMQLFEQREGYDFTFVGGCSDDVDLFELFKAAETLGREELAEDLFRRSLDWGSAEARLGTLGSARVEPAPLDSRGDHT